MRVRSQVARWLINILIIAAVVTGILNIWLLAQQRGIVLDTNTVSRLISSKFNVSDTPTGVLVEKSVIDTGEEAALKPLLTEPYIGCDRTVIENPPNRTVTYLDHDRGIAFDIPYNQNWGSDTFRVAPVEISDESVLFGPAFPSVHVSCAWKRVYELAFLRARSADDVLAGLRGGMLSDNKAEIKIISNKRVVRSEEEGFGRIVHMQVEGNRYNYEFTATCGSDESCEGDLEEIIRSVVLLD
jgi:hypothetical protein